MKKTVALIATLVCVGFLSACNTPTQPVTDSADDIATQRNPRPGHERVAAGPVITPGDDDGGGAGARPADGEERRSGQNRDTRIPHEWAPERDDDGGGGGVRDASNEQNDDAFDTGRRDEHERAPVEDDGMDKDA